MQRAPLQLGGAFFIFIASIIASAIILHGIIFIGIAALGFGFI